MNEPSQDILLCQARILALREALTRLVDHYVRMVNSGDCGSWDPEDEDVIKKARKALK